MTFDQLAAWLSGDRPDIHLANLHASGELARVLPEVDCLYGVPQVAQWHPEVRTGRHIELCLQMAARLTPDVAVRFAALVHDLGKGLTPKEEWPKHRMHEKNGRAPVGEVCERFAAPGDWTSLALLVCEQHLNVHRVFEMRPSKVASFLEKHGLEHDTHRLTQFLLACEADSRGREGMCDKPFPEGEYLRRAQAALAGAPQLENDGPQGAYKASQRIALVSALRHEYVTDQKGAIG